MEMEGLEKERGVESWLSGVDAPVFFAKEYN